MVFKTCIQFIQKIRFLKNCIIDKKKKLGDYLVNHSVYKNGMYPRRVCLYVWNKRDHNDILF